MRSEGKRSSSGGCSLTMNLRSTSTPERESIISLNASAASRARWRGDGTALRSPGGLALSDDAVNTGAPPIGGASLTNRRSSSRSLRSETVSSVS